MVHRSLLALAMFICSEQRRRIIPFKRSKNAGRPHDMAESSALAFQILAQIDGQRDKSGEPEQCRQGLNSENDGFVCKAWHKFGRQE